MKCLLCGSEENEVFTQEESFGFPLTYYQCENCGLVFQSTEESRASDPGFYAETYRKIYQSSEEPTAKDIWVQEHRAEHLVRLIHAKGIDAPERILDIGASTGILLEAFERKYNSDITGVEPGEAYRAYAEEKGINMFDSLESLIMSRPEKFDLVSLIHVLEHLPDPVGTLQKIRKELLSENGVLLIEVPNFYVHDSYELAHLACYTPHTLEQAVNQAGFRLVSLHDHGIPRSILLNLYLTLIAKPLPEGVEVPPLRRERFVRIRRKTSLFYRRLIQKLFPRKAWLPLPEEKES